MIIKSNTNEQIKKYQKKILIRLMLLKTFMKKEKKKYQIILGKII